jgi:hypothetical protein
LREEKPVKKTDGELIDELTRSLSPVSLWRKPVPLLVLWIGTCLAYLSVIVVESPNYHRIIFGPHSWPSIVSWFLLGFTFLISSTGSILSGLPGVIVARRWVVTSWAFVTLWAVWLLLRHLFEPLTFPVDMHVPNMLDWKCARGTFVFGLGPLVMIFGILKGLASVERARTGSLSLIAAFSASGFLIEVACDDESVFHQLWGHWLLLALAGWAGFKLGRRMLRW